MHRAATFLKIKVRAAYSSFERHHPLSPDPQSVICPAESHSSLLSSLDSHEVPSRTSNAQDFAKALEDASYAAELEPRNPKALLRKGTAAFHLDRFDLAREAFTVRAAPPKPLPLRPADARSPYRAAASSSEHARRIAAMPSAPV